MYISPQHTIISMGDHRDVPQYIDHPWFIKCVNARTISAKGINETPIRALPLNIVGRGRGGLVAIED